MSFDFLTFKLGSFFLNDDVEIVESLDT